MSDQVQASRLRGKFGTIDVGLASFLAKYLLR